MERILGALFSPKDIRDFKMSYTKNKTIFAKEFELKMPKVKNQKNVGSCVAHSIATVIEYFNIKQNNNNESMSIGFIYGDRRNSRHKGSGMYVREALANACKYGDVIEKFFPYNEEVPGIIKRFNNSFKDLDKLASGFAITSYYRLSSVEEIKISLLKNGPVVFAMDWYDDIKVKNGVITTKQKRSTGGHAMVIYGWNEKGWKIQNSWGTGFGNMGRAILPYDVKIREAWGIVDKTRNTNINIKKPYSSKAGKLMAVPINFILKTISKR